jgi:hypothetical protein
VAVLAGVFGVGCAKVRSVAAPALTYYSDDMAADFTARESAAESLIQLAQAADVSSELVQAAQKALDASRDAKTPSERYRTGEQLKLSVDLMYNAMPADERDGKGSPAQMAWSEFTSRTNILSHSIPTYNQLAREVQDKLGGFPATLLARMADAQVEVMTA